MIPAEIACPPVTIEKLLLAFGFVAAEEGVDVEEVDTTAWMILRAWRAIDGAPARRSGPALRLVLDEPEPVTTQRLSDADLIARYAQSCQRRNLSPRTIVTIEPRLRAFAKANHGGTLGTVTRADVERLLDARKLSPRTRYWELSMLHNFYAWAIDEELLDVDPTAKIRRPKLTKTLPRPMTDGDLRRAIDNADPMIRCWLLLGTFEGLRCQEIAGVDREDVIEGDMTLRVVYGKGRKQRMLPLHPEVLAALRALPMPEQGPLFRRARMLTRYPPAQLVKELNTYLHSLGITSTAHSLRHRFATTI